MGDLHSALKTEVVARESVAAAEVVLVRLQDSKTSKRWSLHARPGPYTLSGWQTTDVLGTLGFQHSPCGVVTGGQCYTRKVPEAFELKLFMPAFEIAARHLLAAARHLETCGLGLAQPEGWTFFTGRAHDRQRRQGFEASGDGHTSPERTELKRAEDAVFQFVLTYLKGGRDRGWVTHYRPKHPPLSAEVASAMVFIGLREFESCPEFEFEPCRWRFVPKGGGDDPFDRLTMWAHQWFDSHPQNFSPAIEQLLAAQAAVAPFDMAVLPMRRDKAVDRLAPPRRAASETKVHLASSRFQYDVAISFAGTDRVLAERIAVRVRDSGFSVFYDNFYPEELWGKDLAVFFDDVFRKQSRHCLVLISKEYLERPWTDHERRSAIARMLTERGGEYLLPVQIDAVELPGLAPTVGYLSAEQYSADQIADLLIGKLSKGC